MPANYHQQIKQMLSGLAARGLQHNDIWKNNLAAAPFKLELQLKLVDFGTATLNGSYVLCSGVCPTLYVHTPLHPNRIECRATLASSTSSMPFKRDGPR